MFPIFSKTISLHGAANSMQGGRKENQDDLGFIDTPLGFLFVVCDGMGGGPGGKTASAIAKQEIARHLNSCNQLTPRKQALRIAVAKANDALNAAMAANKELRGMGTTVVAILINSESAIVCHAGDSRCYRMHGRLMLFRTQDHSLVGELVRKKVMTEEEARVSPQSNVISKSLGSKTDHNPDIEETGYRKGDRFILCTDGVWGSMPHKKLLKFFAAKGQTANVVGSISSEVDRLGFAKGGHHDNHTIAIIEMDCNSKLHDKWYKMMLTAICGIAALAAFIIGICLYSGSAGNDTASIGNTPQESGKTLHIGNGPAATPSQTDGKITENLSDKNLLKDVNDTTKKKDEAADGDNKGNASTADNKKADADKKADTERKANVDKNADSGKHPAADKNGSKDNKDAGKGKKTVAYGDPAKFKTSVNQALTALDNMLGYHNGNEKKTKEQKGLHADKVIKAIQNLKALCGKQREPEVNGVLAYAKKNKTAMAEVSKGSKSYGSSPKAQGIIKKIKEKLEKIKNNTK